ncbi:MAG: hypothetical protein KF729_26890 [Sandaracinaceae bacterium]|nr:hypothetical protein [Sandaracinaceae bacterium]
MTTTSEQASKQRLLVALSFVLGSMLLLGSTCTPTPTGCDFTGRCDRADLTTAEACINFCAPVFEGDMLGDVMCPLDDCDVEAYLRPDVFRCPSPTAAGQSYRCTPSERSIEPERIGFCRAAAGLFDECDPDDTGAEPRQCESGTFCVNADATDADGCPRAFPLRRRAGLSGSARGFCWLPAREGEPCDGNLDRGPHGCAPCEAGTWCRVTPDHGRICLRACELPGAPGVERPDLCACRDAPEPCVALPGPTDQPQRYCRPLLVPNGNLCNPQGGVPCADTGADCQLTNDPRRGEVFTCCRYVGDPCTSDADCCDGFAVCAGGRCTACGREGQPATSAGCCPGHVVVDEASGEQACRPCAVSREGRAAAPFEGASCGGEFVQLETEAAARDTVAVPEGGNTGAGPAELPRTSGRSQRIRYRLGDRHRLFLLQGDLTGRWDDRNPPADPPDFLPSATAGWPPAGVTVGHRFAQLPANFAGLPVRTIELGRLVGGDPPSTWQSLRVYDAGACSRFVSHRDAVNAVTASLNRFLVDFETEYGGATYPHDPLTLAPVFADGCPTSGPPICHDYAPAHITPILASGSGDFGRAIDSDQLNVFIEYAAVRGSAFGCPGGRFRLSMGVRLRRIPAFAPTLESELEDRRMTEPHECDFAVACRERCWVMPDHYLCQQIGGAPPLRRDFYVRPRRVRALRDAFDFEPVIEFLDGGLVDCITSGLNDALTGRLQAQLRSQFDRVIGQLTGSLERPLTDWGIRREDVPTCGRTDPETGVVFASDAMCVAALPQYFGGRRNGCVGVQESGQWTDDPALAVDFRCERVRFELRRVNVRPDGLEVVLADSTTDPQHRLFTTSPHGALRAYCFPDRDGSLTSDSLEIVTTVARAITDLADSQRLRRICHPDDPLTVAASGVVTGCRGICSDDGTQCGGPAPLPHRLRPGDRRNHALLSCYVQPLPALTPLGPDRESGECCFPSDFCPVPPAGGGRPFFTTTPAPPAAPSTTWRCVQNPSRDRWACGGCGNVCDEAEECCGGGCVSLAGNREHCGACDNACPPGALCADGRCCPAGNSVCTEGEVARCADLLRDPANCGECGAVCASGNCSVGVCCPVGQSNCGGRCFDLTSDPRSCGTCGRTCQPGEACCDGVCADLGSNTRHCGACGARCPPNHACRGGTCQICPFPPGC